MAAVVPKMVGSSAVVTKRTVTVSWPAHYASFYGGDDNFYSVDPSYYYVAFATEWPHVSFGTLTTTASKYITSASRLMCTIANETSVIDQSIAAGSLTLYNVPVGSFVGFAVVLEDWYNSSTGDSSICVQYSGNTVSASRYFSWHSTSSTYSAPTLSATNCSVLSAIYPCDILSAFVAPIQIYDDNTSHYIAEASRVCNWMVV